MKSSHWLWYALLILVFMIGLVIRVSDLFDAPLDFHPTRQLHSALIARGMFYEKLDNAPDWQREMAFKQWQAEGLIEPQIMERLTALLYRIFGVEHLWFARLWAILFWMIGGVFLFLITEEIADFAGGTFAVIFYMIWPYAAFASRAFQPEPLLIASLLASLWAFNHWIKSEKWPWAVGAGILIGFTIYVKSVAIFYLAPAIIGVVIQKFTFKKAIKNRQVWLVAILSLLPYIAYLYFGIAVIGTLGPQFSFRFFPQRWIDPLFYIQWMLNLNKTINVVIILAGILGITLFTKKEHFLLLAGFLLGYLLSGFVFSYHITTHDYYHLPLMIPIAIGLGIILGKVFGISERNRNITNAVFALAALLFIGLNAWEIRSDLSRYDFQEEIENWKIVGDRLGHEVRVIGVFEDYGYRLAYWGWTHATSWTSSGDAILRELAGLDVKLDTRFKSRTEGFDFFIVSNQEELDRQENLKSYLDEKFLKFEQVGDIRIYDLRAALE